MSSRIIDGLRYTEKHEWVKDNGDGTLTCGITDYAQAALGDVVYIELPAAGRSFKTGDSLGVIESVKAAEDMYAPLSGSIVSFNEAIKKSPALVNQDPFGEGWFIVIKPEKAGDFAALLSAADYAKLTTGQA